MVSRSCFGDFTFDGDGVWDEDGAADAVDSWENDHQVVLVTRIHSRHWLFVELKERNIFTHSNVHAQSQQFAMHCGLERFMPTSCSLTSNQLLLDVCVHLFPPLTMTCLSDKKLAQFI